MSRVSKEDGPGFNFFLGEGGGRGYLVAPLPLILVRREIGGQPVPVFEPTIWSIPDLTQGNEIPSLFKG